MNYYREYKLLVDLPTGHKAGRLLRPFTDNTNIMRFYFTNEDGSYGLEHDGLSFDIDQIQNTYFFKSIGKPYPFVKPFPNKNKIKEFYYLIGESRLVPDVDEIRLINPIFYSDDFYDDVYELLKKKYNEYYKLNN